MKFLDISSSFVKEIILEAENKNTHLEHLEDNIFNKGYQGAKEAIDYLFSLHEMLEGNSESPVSMTTKWDGAPAIIAGRDPETGKFFVGTKGVFALKHLVLFSKCTNLCASIELYLKNDYPLIIEYMVASLGEIKLCLAPKVDS